MKGLYTIILLALLGGIQASALAQGSYRVALVPQANVNLPLKGDLRLNLALESRPLRAAAAWDEPFPRFAYRLSDLSAMAAWKAGPGHTWSGGYLIRHTRDGFRHRLMQQYSIVRPFAGLRLAHRVAADQTFGVDDPAVYRLRYRLGLELPLNGQRADPGEGYLKLTHEYLNVLENREYDLEIRLSALAGRLITDRNKVESGLEYRIDGFLAGAPRHTLFLRVNWYLKR